MAPRGRGLWLTPANSRTSRVWIGGAPGNAVFVRRRPHAVVGACNPSSSFLNDLPEPTSPWSRRPRACAVRDHPPVSRRQRRVGRLLIALQLAADGLMREPLLYPEPALPGAPADLPSCQPGAPAGDWEAWLEFFAEAVHASADWCRRRASGCSTRLGPMGSVSSRSNCGRIGVTIHRACSASRSPARRRWWPPPA